METTLTIDLGVIVAALAPTIAIVAAAILAKRDSDRSSDKLDGIHTLVNNAMTQEKRTRLEDLLAQKIVLERVLGEDMNDQHRLLLESMKERIANLADEIESRDLVAEQVSGFSKEE